MYWLNVRFQAPVRNCVWSAPHWVAWTVYPPSRCGVRDFLKQVTVPIPGHHTGGITSIRLRSFFIALYYWLWQLGNGCQSQNGQQSWYRHVPVPSWQPFVFRQPFPRQTRPDGTQHLYATISVPGCYPPQKGIAECVDSKAAPLLWELVDFI